MKYLFFIIFLLGCSNTERSYYSDSYKEYCNKECHKDYGTEVDWVGQFSGKCYCK